MPGGRAADGPGDRLAVLLAAGGSAWEPSALRALAGAGVVVLKRCVDLADLMASAGSGLAEVAVVAADLPGLDAAAVQHLLRHDVRAVGVGTEPMTPLARIGVADVLAETQVDRLPDVVRRVRAQEPVEDPDPAEDLPPPDDGGPGGRVVAVWGPAGAPGRTTVAVNLAAELALRRTAGRVVLADLDPYGGAIAQHLGVLDEVSGLLVAARLVNSGELDVRRFAAARRVVQPRLELVSGLPRPDRWIEVRGGVVAEILGRAAALGDVVADTGFGLEDGEADYGRPGAGRNRMTLEALAEAEEVVVVGAADPVGLARLARGLVDLAETLPGVTPHVVVNRMRDTLGWAERDIRGMVEGFTRPRSITFLPEDRPTCDRALVAGRALAETGDSALRRSLATLVDLVFPDSVGVPQHLGRQHLGRRRRQAPKSR